MTIEQAFDHVLSKSANDCCMSNQDMKALRSRYRSGAQIGHKTYLRLLRCQGFVITVTKEDDPERIREIVTTQP